MTHQSNTIHGKCSNFGGPHDHGVKPNEGLALYDQEEVSLIFKNTSDEYTEYQDLFLRRQPKGTSGTARRLNPLAYYIACRWNYVETPHSHLRKTQVTVSAKKTAKSFLAWPVDWGPNVDTGRIADLSPELMKDLGIETDDEVTVVIPLP